MPAQQDTAPHISTHHTVLTKTLHHTSAYILNCTNLCKRRTLLHSVPPTLQTAHQKPTGTPCFVRPRDTHDPDTNNTYKLFAIKPHIKPHIFIDKAFRTRPCLEVVLHAMPRHSAAPVCGPLGGNSKAYQLHHAQPQTRMPRLSFSPGARLQSVAILVTTCTRNTCTLFCYTKE